MPRTSAGRRNLGADAAEAKALLKRAAEICVERHGVHKTTMEDIAREAGVSRPTVYRYFDDRDDILVAVLADRSRALIDRAHRFIAKQPTFADKLVEGLIYIADHGRRDPFTRHLVTNEDGRLARVVMASGAGGRSAAEFWEPVFDSALARGELAQGIDRDLAYEWLAEVGLMLMSQLDRDEPTDRLRAKLNTFVLAAFTAGGPVHASGTTPERISRSATSSG